MSRVAVDRWRLEILLLASTAFPTASLAGAVDRGLQRNLAVQSHSGRRVYSGLRSSTELFRQTQRIGKPGEIATA